MRNNFLFLIFSVFLHSLSYALPNDIMFGCNLPAPGNLHSVEIDPSNAVMAWDAVPGAVAYEVSWYDESGSQLGTEHTPDTEHEITGLESGKTYTVRVASVCLDGNVSPIYVQVPVAPIILELVISSDNPLGNLNQVCSQPVNPVAECTFDFALASTYIGKIKVVDLNRVYYFRVQYLNYEGKGGTSKVVLDLIKPEYYPELPVSKPKLLTENGSQSGPIYDHGVGKFNYYNPLFEIRITKLFNKIFKINLLKTNQEVNNLEFIYYYTNIPSYNSPQSTDFAPIYSVNKEINNPRLEKPISDINIFNVFGQLIITKHCDTWDFDHPEFLNDLLPGVYFAVFTGPNTISTEKYIIDIK